MNRFSATFCLIFIGLFGFSQNNIQSSNLWQVENVANGKSGTFNLIVMDDETCSVSLVTEDNTYHSKDCFIGKSTVTDYDGNLYQLDFNSASNFGVSITLKGNKTTLEFRTKNTSTIAKVSKATPSIQKKPKEVEPEKTVVQKEQKVKEKEIKEEKIEPKVAKVTKTEVKEKEAKPAVVKEASTTSNTSTSKIKSSSNRKILYQPEVVNSCTKVYGTIVFDVTLSTSGRVLSSKINISQSNNPTSCLVSSAIDLLKQMRWETIEANYEEDLEVIFDYEKEAKKKKK